MDDARTPDDPFPGGDDRAGPPPLHERAWRHPSELATVGRSVPADTVPADTVPWLHRVVMAVTTVATLVVMAGITRLLDPGRLEQTVTVTDSTPVVRSGPTATDPAPPATTAPDPRHRDVLLARLGIDARDELRTGSPDGSGVRVRAVVVASTSSHLHVADLITGYVGDPTSRASRRATTHVVRTMAELSIHLGSRHAGDRIALIVSRDGDTRIVRVVVDN